MPTLAQHLAHAAELLVPMTDTPRVDAEILLAHALGISRPQLLTRLNESLPVGRFDALLRRRLAYEPIAYILGEWEFFSLNFEVVSPILVPRPETEHLVEAVLDEVGGTPARILELCTGCGCVGVAVAVNASQVRMIATDIRSEAVELARRNAVRHGVADRIEFRTGDLFDPISAESALFDVVCANPPYVEEDAWDELSPVIRLHEDPRALLAGKDGLAVVRRLIEGAVSRLSPRGLLAFEVGMGQYDRVCRLLVGRGYDDVGCRRDLAGIERIVLARKPVK